MLDVCCYKGDEVTPRYTKEELEGFFKGSFFDFPLAADARLKARVAAYSLLYNRLMESSLHKDHPLKAPFSYPRYGKVGIASVGGLREVWVSISYSGEYVMCGISSQPIGVDVQKVRHIPLAMLEAISSNAEKGFIYGFSLTAQCQLFSLKESYAKAIQSGMVFPAVYAEYDALFELQSHAGQVYSKRHNISGSDYVASVSCVPEPFIIKGA